MPRQFALLLCIGLIVWLFRADMRWRKLTSGALWIPGIWLAIIGSRPLAYWFGDVSEAGGANPEGSPVNLIAHGALMAAALFVLQRRVFSWGTFFRANKLLLILYAYFACSALWSYFPVPSIKRILKDFGAVLMVLVILTETNPGYAVRLLFVRVSYLLFPLSALLIKYYPEYGRMYSKSWEVMYTGVTTHKNTLGMVVLVFGLVLLWEVMELRQNKGSAVRKTDLRIRYGMLLMGGWLLVMSDSKTSLLCAILGGLFLWASRFFSSMRNPGSMAAVSVGVALSLLAVNSVFGVSKAVLEVLGRNQNLTGRTEVWEMIQSQPINPLIGYGFMAFWDGPMGQLYHEATETALVSTHNGYLETYVDGGLLAVALLVLFLLAGFWTLFNELLTGSLYWRILFAFSAVAVVYNWSESSFFRLGPMWFALILAMVRCPRDQFALGQHERHWEQNESLESVPSAASA